MKKNHWKILTLIFITAGTAILLSSFIAPASTPSPTVQQYQITSEPVEMNIPLNYKPLHITPTVDPDHLDQYSCETVDDHWMVTSSTVWILQEFVNEGEPLEAYSVLITEYKSPTDPLIIGVVDSKMPINDLCDLDNWECYGVLQPNSLPSDWPDFYWITADFSSNPVNIPAGQKYYLAVVSGAADFSVGYFGVAFDITGGSYPYTSWDYYFPEGQYYDTHSDICFATYTTTGGGDGNGGPPSITITSQWAVSMQFAGAFCYLGAALSGAKYLLMVV